MKYSEKRKQIIAEMMASDDYTIAELCKGAGISEATFYNWKNKEHEDYHPDFVEALEEAEEKRLQLFRKSARSGLLTLLKGMTFEETATEYVEKKIGTDAEGKDILQPRIKSRKTIKKHILPNPAAVIFTLKNVDSANFKDVFDQNIRDLRIDVEVTD